jgi:predicted transcriptional regulator
MAIKIDNIKDLKNLDKAVRKVILKHIKDVEETPTGFAKSVGIHPLQMLRYVNEGKNMRFDTLLKIGKKAKLKKS